MSLDRSTVKEFADYLNGSDEGELASLSLIGTATVDGSGNISVLLDGCDTATPVSSILSGTGETASVKSGDRVLVIIQNRTATIIGNFTEDPAAAAKQMIDDVSVEYDKLKYAVNSSSENPPEWSAFSDYLPTINSGQYLWQWKCKVNSETEEEEPIGDPQLANIMSGVYAFINGCNDGTTVINGGCITTGTINAEYIKVGQTQLDTKIGTMDTNIAGKYTKPSSGIPDSDLAESYASSSDVAGAANTANYYLTTITGRTGICVHSYADYNNYVNINSEGMSIYGTANKCAQFTGTALNLFYTNSSEHSSDISLGGAGAYLSGDDTGSLYLAGKDNVYLSTSQSTATDSALYVFGRILPNGTTYKTVGKAATPWTSMYTSDGYAWTLAPPDKGSGATYGNAHFYKTSAGNYALCRYTGSSRNKKNTISDITEPDLDPKKLLELHPRQYILNAAPEEGFTIGFIAEEVAEIYPAAAQYDWDEKTGEEFPTFWNEEVIIPAMLKLIQDQQKEIDELKRDVDILKEGI